MQSARTFVLVNAALCAALAEVATAQPWLADDFESGLAAWARWPEATERLQLDGAHTHSGVAAAKAVEADPWGYASYADFGAQSGSVYAEVWVWDDLGDDGSDPDRPVSIMLALVGASADPAAWTDYQQLGVVAWYDPLGLSQKYYIRTRQRDVTQPGSPYLDTGVFRKRGWTKLAIRADALSNGGLVRFYIDDAPVGTSQRTSGVDLQYVRLGVNFKSYDSIWYDDAWVGPEPRCAEPAADVDADGDVDLSDFASFLSCFNGPGRAWPPEPVSQIACACLDADDDLDVDLSDFSVFLACFNGPARPPACSG